MSALTDNIDRVGSAYKNGTLHPGAGVAAVLAAARLVAEAPEVWWCETHQCTGSDLWCQAPERHWEDCEMVRKLLVDP